MARPAKNAEGTTEAVEMLPVYTVAVRAQDITRGKDPNGDPYYFEVGEDVSHLEADRLNQAVALGIVTKTEPEAPKETEE